MDRPSTIKLLLSLPLALFLGSCGTESSAALQSSAAPVDGLQSGEGYVTMLRNTAITVTLLDSIDTEVQQTGTEFRAMLARSIVVDRHTVFADGAGARGVLSRVINSGRLKTPAEVSFRLTAIQNESGRWVEVGTNTIHERKATYLHGKIIMIGGGGLVSGGGTIGGRIGKLKEGENRAYPDAGGPATSRSIAPAVPHVQDIFHEIGTEVVFFSNQSTRIALRP
jgi:hypothetical protein